MFKIISISILLISLNACYINRFKFDSSHNLKHPINTEFCKLTQFDSSNLVKVRCYYSGVDEYWGLFSDEECTINHKVEFYFDDEGSKRNAINAYFLGRRLRKIYRNYDKYVVEFELTGYFNKSNDVYGFGHLGHNKYEFSAKRVRVVKYIQKKNMKVKY
jgi:hypothetical protein